MSNKSLHFTAVQFLILSRITEVLGISAFNHDFVPCSGRLPGIQNLSAIGSGQEYQILSHFFCTLCYSKTLLPCKNHLLFSHGTDGSRFFDLHNMQKGWLTQHANCQSPYCRHFSWKKNRKSLLYCFDHKNWFWNLNCKAPGVLKPVFRRNRTGKSLHFFNGGLCASGSSKAVSSLIHHSVSLHQ